MSSMKGNLTTYGRNVFVNALFTEGMAIPSLWLGLMLVPPDESDDGALVTEVPSELVDPVTFVKTATGYGRLSVPSATPDGLPYWTRTMTGVMTYTGELSYGEAKADWGYVTSWGLFTGATDGNLIAAGNAGFVVHGPGEPGYDGDPATGDIVRVPENGLTLEITRYG